MSDYAKYLKNMPVMPDVAAKIMSIAEDKIDISFRDLEQTIKLDPGLSTKILKVANSALYARQKEISSLQMAITLLGFRNIKSLVLLVTASNMFAKQQTDDFYKFFWKHSVINAFMARNLAKLAGNRAIEEESFLAGMLHDIGQVALHNADSEKYVHVLDGARSRSLRISQTEEELYGTNHREVGAEVLKGWNFPDVYVDAASEHGSPNITSPHKQTILLVSIADFLTSNIDLYDVNPLNIELLDDIVKQTSFTQAALSEFSATFLDDLQTDQLFTECKNLFKIE